jgi:uncharacterized glyoxalase superfamily protein PhnB
MSKKFTGFGLLTNDVKRLRLFYKDVLESEVEDNDVHCLVKIGDFSFAIYNPNLHEKAEALFKTFGNSSLWLEFQVADVDEEYERLKNLNIQPMTKPKNTEFGRRVFFIEDPDGNKITFYQAP